MRQLSADFHTHVTPCMHPHIHMIHTCKNNYKDLENQIPESWRTPVTPEFWRQRWMIRSQRLAWDGEFEARFGYMRSCLKVTAKTRKLKGNNYTKI